MSQRRVDRLRDKLREKSLDGFLVTGAENRRYLSGFTGTTGVLLITLQRAYFLTDFRYAEQVKQQSPHFELVETKGPFSACLGQLANDLGIQAVGFEGDILTVDAYHQLTEKVAAVWQAEKGLVESLRSVKDEEELKLIEQAAALTDEAFAYILDHLKPGVKEREIALALEFFMRRQGAAGPSFDYIVASGQRSSLPHGVASEKAIEQGDLVTLDFGCIVDGYCSDFTRTVVVGTPTKEQEKVYSVVLEAQQKGLEAVRAGMKAVDVDGVARKVIADAGYGEYFGHGLGHGVGLAIHESPNLGVTSTAVLEEGMVVTVEPGIYIPGWGGVRIEDLVVVTRDGCRNLTRSTKELLTL